MTQQTSTPAHASTAAATDVAEFISDLDGGQLERKLSIALSQVAAACSDHNEKSGTVTLKLSFKAIKGTHQVICKHALAYTRPTLDGSASEDETRDTVLYVGPYGRLSLAQQPLRTEQGDLLG